MHTLNATYLHPTKGERNVLLDEAAVTAFSDVTAVFGPAFLASELSERIQQLVDGYADAYKLITDAFRGWVIGVSGFATHGFDYSQEAAVLGQLYAWLATKNALPKLAIDGGVTSGAPQENANAATAHGVRTLGCVPFSALQDGDIGKRHAQIIWGATYAQREELVGTIPDLLVCCNGAIGTQREAEWAAQQGSTILLISTKESGLCDTYQASQVLRRAKAEQRLYTWELQGNVPLETVLSPAFQRTKIGLGKSRHTRTERLASLLG